MLAGAGRMGILWADVDGERGCSTDEEEGREGNQELCSGGECIGKWSIGSEDEARGTGNWRTNPVLALSVSELPNLAFDIWI